MKISEDNFSTIANPTSQPQSRFIETLARSGKSVHTIKAYSVSQDVVVWLFVTFDEPNSG
jgi:hypothetical protein